MRRVFAILIGSVLAFALVAAIESISATLYPVSGDIAATDPATLSTLVASIPLPAKGIIVSGWLLAPFAGAWLCLRIGGWSVSAIFLVGGLVAHSGMPYPAWMHVSAIVLPLLGGWVAQRLHRKPYPGEPLLG